MSTYHECDIGLVPNDEPCKCERQRGGEENVDYQITWKNFYVSSKEKVEKSKQYCAPSENYYSPPFYSEKVLEVDKNPCEES
jgi:hypothetical protein